MRYRMTVLFAFLLGSLPLAAKDQDADKAQVVSTAEILKIDAKKQSLQVQDLVDVPAPTSDRGPRRQGGGGGGGGGGGRRRTGGGAGGVRLPGGVGFPGGGNGAPTLPKAKQYKVFVGKDTVMKLAEANIDFTDLHVGDHIIVSGTPKGHDVNAVTITKDLH